MAKVVKKTYSTGRVIRLTVINFSLNLLAATYFTVIFIFTVLKFKTIGLVEIIAIAFFALMLAITFYGNGIYITAITLENHIKSIAIDLFHGPISHILIYSSYLIIFLLLSILDITGENSIFYTQYFLLIGGVITGVGYAIAQIINLTSKYQIIPGLIIFCLYITFIIYKNQNLWFHPIALFFLPLIIAYVTSLFVYIFAVKNKMANFISSYTLPKPPEAGRR